MGYRVAGQLKIVSMNKLSSFFCFILVGTYLIVKVLILGFSPIRELYTLQEGEKCEVRAAAAL